MAGQNKTAAAVRLGLPADYVEFLESLKTRVRQAQTKAMLSVNREMIALYWDIGRQIAERQERDGWGKSVVDRLAADIQQAFPGIGGFSPSNVWRMRAFFLAYRPTTEFLAQPVRELAREPKVAQAVREIGEPIPSQAVTELNLTILPQPMAGIPWGKTS
ncbi:MAG: DUF1016 N-terminal domain-containing protein [Planctomycetaceae bacterium]